MKKFFKVLFTSLLVVIIIISGTLFYKTYLTYEKHLNQMGVSEVKNYIKEVNPNYVEFKDISKDLLDATYAVEDRRFFQRDGIDYIAIARALITNIARGTLVEGGSTITQQLVKIVYYDYDLGFFEKMSEYFFIYDFEKEYSKNEILEMYVNIINYGDGYIGIENAAQGYFNKSASELDLFEGSLLAAIPNAPAIYQLSNNNPDTLKRQRKVLGDMLELGIINQGQYDECINRQEVFNYEK